MGDVGNFLHVHYMYINAHEQTQQNRFSYFLFTLSSRFQLIFFQNWLNLKHDVVYGKFIPTELKGMSTSLSFSAFFIKGNNFRDILFASLDDFALIPFPLIFLNAKKQMIKFSSAKFQKKFRYTLYHIENSKTRGQTT